MLVVIGVRKQQLSIKYSRISRCRFVTKALIRKTELLSHRPKKPQQLSPTHTLNNNNENIGIEIDFSQHPSTRGCFYFYLFVIPWNQSGFGKHRIWDHWLMLTHTIRSSIVTIENQFFDKKTQKKKIYKIRQIGQTATTGSRGERMWILCTVNAFMRCDAIYISITAQARHTERDSSSMQCCLFPLLNAIRLNSFKSIVFVYAQTQSVCIRLGRAALAYRLICWANVRADHSDKWQWLEREWDNQRLCKMTNKLASGAIADCRRAITCTVHSFAHKTHQSIVENMICHFATSPVPWTMTDRGKIKKFVLQ